MSLQASPSHSSREFPSCRPACWVIVDEAHRLQGFLQLFSPAGLDDPLNVILYRICVRYFPSGGPDINQPDFHFRRACCAGTSGNRLMA